jgi:hypothetical protein
MGQSIDLQQQFKKYFNELEAWGLRSERFYEEYYQGAGKDPERMISWLRAAFLEGALVMAQDTLNTLNDYGTAVSGVDKLTHTTTERFDGVRKNLEQYYRSVMPEYYFMSVSELRERCDGMIVALLGDDMADKWWQRPNLAMNSRTPADVFAENPLQVYTYLAGH